MTDTYRKDLKFPPGHGYGRETGTSLHPVWVAERPGPVTSILIHSTNNPNKGTKFENEAAFIRDSPDISAHELIGKAGQVAVFLLPNMQAWHSGSAFADYVNAKSYGIELQISIGEQPTEPQLDTLTRRVAQLIATYGITKQHIDTHRKVALPAGRKSDPEGFSDPEFYQWRESLYLPAVPPPVDYAAAWGPLLYHPEWGIETAWRQSYKTLGQAMTDETRMADGRVLRAFQWGCVVWSPTTVEVWT